MKAILDTNIVMSGIFWSGYCRNILLLIDEKKFEHLCSKEIADEYIDTANRLKKFDPNLLDELIDMILVNSIFCEPTPGSEPECRDSKDQMFLDLAVSMGAKYWSCPRNSGHPRLLKTV